MTDRELEIKGDLEGLEGWVMWGCPDDDDDDEGGLEAKDKGFGEFYPPSVDLGVNDTDAQFDIIEQDKWWDWECLIRGGEESLIDEDRYYLMNGISLDYTVDVVDWDEDDEEECE